MMGDFELIGAPELDAYLRALGPILLEACPAEGREQLGLGLSRLDESRQALATKVEIVHRQTGAPEPVARVAAASAQQAAAEAPRALSAIAQGLGRLPLLLQRLEQVAVLQAKAAAAPAAATQPAAQAAPLAAGRTALVADAVLEASLQAKDGAELQQYLDRIRGLGIVGGTDEMFRALGRSVSGWTLPAIPDVPALPEGGQVSAMRRMIALADEPGEVGRRFREMVHVAVEQFNEGSYGRSLKMFGLARQMVAEGQVKASFIEPMVASGHEYLAEERVRKLAERPESHFFLRPVLGFFQAYAPERLLDELQAEQRRDRRRQFLNLLEAHGAPARVAAWERLQADRDGSAAGLYFVRNVVHLLRTIPRSAETSWPVDEEIDAIAPFIEPGQPLFLVKEALQYMLATHQPRAEGHLLAQFRAVERAIQMLPASAEDRPVLLVHLDRTAATLARYASPRAWAALVEHALARHASSGDTLSRLAELSGQDLSTAPAVVAKLVAAVEENLPRGMLGRLGGEGGRPHVPRHGARLDPRAGSGRAARERRLALRQPGLRQGGAESRRRHGTGRGDARRPAVVLGRSRPLRPAQPAAEPLRARQDGHAQPAGREGPARGEPAARGRRHPRRPVRGAAGQRGALPADRASLHRDVRLRSRAKGGSRRTGRSCRSRSCWSRACGATASCSARSRSSPKTRRSSPPARAPRPCRTSRSTTSW